MNALAKTSDFFPDANVSGYYDPAIFKTNRPLKDSLFNECTVSGTAVLEPSLQVKASQLHLFPQKAFVFPRNFKLLQQWEGVVEKVEGDVIVAIITDKKNVDNPTEEVEIYLSEIDKEDMSFVRPGAFFYWSVGYEDGLGVPRQRVSRIRFKRLAGITTRDIARAVNNAKKLNELFV